MSALKPIWALSALLFCAELRSATPSAWLASRQTPPAPPQEFRGAWVATVGNIDWPSKPGLPVEQQKAELLALLERASQLRLNVIILQVRPSCDALYASKLEPWSEYLTGQMGKAPEPAWDPLAFAIEEAHQRGLELHAWFNPFRARHTSAKTPPAAKHISRQNLSWVKTYGKHLWLDPGDNHAQDYSLKVIADVVRRYDLDGVHIDDYFYPYREKDNSGKEIDFPDYASWNRYRSEGGKLLRDDWRRENVNRFVRRLNQSVHAEKPGVKFGVSPFGIWRPGTPAGIKGYDPYDKLFADAKKWLNEGWLDYFAPQLYWSIDAKEQSFPVLLRWWAGENPHGRLICPGLNTARTTNTWPPAEILRQIQLCRDQPGAGGHIHWSIKSVVSSQLKTGDALAAGPYASPALWPATPWLESQTPAPPRLFVGVQSASGALALHWEPAGKTAVRWWALQTRVQGQWQMHIYPGTRTNLNLAADFQPEVIALTAVDRAGKLSPPVAREKGK